jgi:diadenosine hexaphosphate hydrolase (ATP-forming)
LILSLERRDLRVEQAGGIVVRRDAAGLSVLLVRSKKDPTLWIFPKGHIEPGESPESTALRETYEESGIEGTLGGAVGEPLEFDAGPVRVRVQYFLIRPTGESPSPEGREKRWFALDEARRVLAFENARRLLDDVEGTRSDILN